MNMIKKSKISYNFNLGIYYFEKNKLEKAIKFFNNCLNLDSKFIQAILYNAKSHVLLNKFEIAFNLYNNAIKINPNDLDLWINATICLISAKKYEDALNFLDESNKIFSENMDLIWLKVEIYERSNNLEKIIELSEYYLSPNHYNQKIAIQLKAHGFFLTEDYKNAIKYYKELAHLDKFDISAYYGLYLSNLNLNNIDEAKKSLDNMIKIDGNNSDFYFYYANLLKNNGEYTNANKYYDKSISIKEDFRYYYSKGEVLERLNKKKEAISSYQKGLQLIYELLDNIYFDEEFFKKINDAVNLFLEKLEILSDNNATKEKI